MTALGIEFDEPFEDRRIGAVAYHQPEVVFGDLGAGGSSEEGEGAKEGKEEAEHG
jgi:hypothetical protein